MTIRKNWTRRGGWTGFGNCVVNEDGSTPNLVMEFATHGEDEVPDKDDVCDITKRIGILLNAFAGIKTNKLHKYVRRTK